MLALTTPTKTMSSREMADLTEKRHDSVKRSIETLIEKGVISQPQIVDGPKAANGVIEKLYLIEKRDSFVVVAQLSPEFTARIVDRWQELEAQQGFQVPSTLSGALRLAAEQAELIEKQAIELVRAQPAVEFLGRYVEAKSTKSLREVAKVLGVPERQFIKQLEEEGILFRQSGCLLPTAEHQHAGRFEVKTGETNGHAYHQTRFTPEGIAWVAKRITRKTSHA